MEALEKLYLKALENATNEEAAELTKCLNQIKYKLKMLPYLKPYLDLKEMENSLRLYCAIFENEVANEEMSMLLFALKYYGKGFVTNETSNI